MATALDAAHTRQSIPVVPTEEAEQISALLSLFDEALAIQERIVALCSTVAGGHSSSNNLLFIRGEESPYAEYALRLWASAKQLPIRESISHYEPGTFCDPRPCSIRSLHVGNELLRIQWNPEFAGELNPPVESEPAKVIPLPVAPPSEVSSDDTVTRFSLLEID